MGSRLFWRRAGRAPHGQGSRFRNANRRHHRPRVDHALVLGLSRQHIWRQPGWLCGGAGDSGCGGGWFAGQRPRDGRAHDDGTEAPAGKAHVHWRRAWDGALHRRRVCQGPGHEGACFGTGWPIGSAGVHEGALAAVVWRKRDPHCAPTRDRRGRREDGASDH